MKTINAKCTNEDSFKYSILTSLHYYELNTHKERVNQLINYIDHYKFSFNRFDTFESNNPNVSLNVFDENGKLIHKNFNNSINKAYIVKIDNNRYYALKPDKDKYIQLKELLRQFSQKEVYDLMMKKITY